MAGERHPGSFRDPAGHVVLQAGVPVRHVTEAGRDDYQALIDSGLYAALVADGSLIPHEDLGRPSDLPPDGTHTDTWRVLRPERVPMISYAHEWSFSQLKDAALL
ncbi:MAG: SAM-dependent methyltransferase, partial [Candidatus Latescibacteria bacterium]|nr:SAM-dependent methyltransferase [Candidatus Latescibacterota bacterium]